MLDIGVAGAGLTQVAPRVRSVTGIDIMPEEIEAAEKLKQHDNVSLSCLMPNSWAAFPGEFDAVFSRYCFHHLQFQKVAEGIKRKLKPGGRLIAVDCLEDYWKLSGSFFILFDAIKRLGIMRFLTFVPRLPFFLPLNGFSM